MLHKDDREDRRKSKLRELLFIVLAFLALAAPSFADIIVPPTVWELLSDRPRTERPVVDLPDPASDDAAISHDVKMSDEAVSDDVSADVTVRSDDRKEKEASS